jgi:hypothetical protein
MDRRVTIIFAVSVVAIVSWLLGHKAGSDQGASVVAAVCARLMLDGVGEKQIKDALHGVGRVGHERKPSREA